MNTVNIIVYSDGRQQAIPVEIEKLPPALQEKYKPFAGKTVTWVGDKIIEKEIKQ